MEERFFWGEGGGGRTLDRICARDGGEGGREADRERDEGGRVVGGSVFVGELFWRREGCDFSMSGERGPIQGNDLK